jgi:hypothetical protein
VAVRITVAPTTTPQPEVVAPPLASVQSGAAVPDTVPAVRSLVSVPWRALPVTLVFRTGLVRVLFVSTSDVAWPTRVSVVVGSVRVPVLVIVEITGLLIVGAF